MKKILFIGNSLTGHIFETFTWMVENFASDPFLVDQVWGGGATLELLLSNGRAEEALAREKWDIVLLQEQSQLPAIPGSEGQSFLDSVKILSSKIKSQGAEPILYETWAHLQGDRQRKELYPDYESMQRGLSDAYGKAASENSLKVIPIGQIWLQFKSVNPELFARLVEDDQYHPSGTGQFFNSAIFFHLLLGQDLNRVDAKNDLDPDDCKVLLDFIKTL